MNILMVHNDHRQGGGSDVVAAATVRLLRERGHVVQTFWRDSRALGGWIGRLHAFGAGMYPPVTLRGFTRVLDHVRPDIVHAHDVYPLISPWIFRICRHKGIPSVVTLHDYRMTCPVLTHFRAGRVCTECLGQGLGACVRYNCRGHLLESLAYAGRNLLAQRCHLFDAVDGFLTPSAFARDWMIRNAGIAPERIRVVHNPVPDPAVGVEYAPDPRPYMAYAGRLSAEKGIDVAIRAAVESGLPLRLAGDCRGFAAGANPAAPNVRFAGLLGGEEYERFLAGARMLVVPSLWFETFGLVWAEAMARGIPVVASRIGALETMIQDGVTGLLVPPGDVKALAAAMRRLWEDPELCRRLGQNGRTYVRQFTPERYATDVEAAYGESLRKRTTFTNRLTAADSIG